ncbi:MAG TPA: RsmE family RNA methyltransferase [Kofleriaceae bacterium]|nr:RsmE family RNA methyltransferase [Kofleriaceae bacterium]
MNLLLVEPSEISDGMCTVRDRRAAHLRTVLGAGVGAWVRAGVIGGALGRAELVADDGAAITLRLALTDPASVPLPIELVLAIPRPKVLTRVIEAAASFGIARTVLTNAWRVDKSYLSSPRLAAEALGLAARLGAEQGATTHVPEIVIYRRLMELIDARWPAARPAERAVDRAVDPPLGLADPAAHRPADPATDPAAHSSADPAAHRPAVLLLAHPGAPPIEVVVPVGSAAARAPIVLAIGPEGGWIVREVETFLARGFAPVSLGAPILRVETAVAAALGQLILLRRLAGATGPAPATRSARAAPPAPSARK